MAGENDYPNVDNSPSVFFPTPIPAPDVDPDSGDLLYVAYNPFWAEVLAAAMMALMQPSTWQGDHDEIITAQNRANNLLVLLQTPVVPPQTTVDTPYWDDATDVDDEAEIVDQTWYGEVVDPTVAPTDLTFIENVSIWAFTGLLAVATPEVGFAPAIAFATIAPKFVIAIRTGDLGRIIRLYVDGSKAAEVTDDGSGDIVNMPVVANPALDSHQIYITAE